MSRIETQSNSVEPSHVPDAAASESGLRSFTNKLGRKEGVLGMENFGNPESLKPLAKEAWYLARNLEKWKKVSKIPEQQRAEIQKIQGLVRQFTDRLSSLIEFHDPKFQEQQEDKETLNLAITQIKTELEQLQQQITQVPIESRLNPKHIRSFIKRAAGVASLLAAGSGIHESKKYLDKHHIRAEQQQLEAQKQNEKNTEDLIKHRPWRHQADMRGEGEPGRFSTGRYFAKVEYSWGSNINDPLWATEFTYRSSPDEFYTIRPKEGPSKDASGKTQAEVVMQPMSVKDHEIINLPVPVGYKMSWLGTNNDKLIASYNDASHSIFFDKSAENVNIRYGVEESNEQYDLPTPKDYYNLYRTPEATETIDKLKQPEVDIPQTLNRHLANFTYITSNELQELLDALPGRLEEKIGALKVGDCDMLAYYSAGLLNDAGKKSMVAIGVLEQHHKLDAARPHAKLVYFDKAGRPRTLETTSATKRQYVNLKFLPEDKAKLQAIANKARSTPERFANSLEAFRTELENILNSGNYNQYEAKNGFHENPGLKDLLNLLTELPKQLSTADMPDSTAGTIGIIILAALLEIALVLGLGYAGIKTLNSASKKLKESQDKNALNFLKEALVTELIPDQGGMNSTEQETAITRLIRSEYSHQPNFEKLYPLAEAERLNFGQKSALVRFLRVYDQLTVPEPEIKNGWINSIIAHIQWRKLMSKAEADGLNLEKLTEAIRSLMIDKRVQKEFTEQIPEQAKAIFDMGKKEIVSVVEPLDKIGKASRENIFRHLEITEQAGANSERASKKRAKIEPSVDFYDHAPYAPGMDTRSIDWRAYMRTEKLYVKRSPENAMPNHETSTFNLLVDSSAHDSQLADLASLLLYAQKHPKEISLSSITFTHAGQFTERMDQPTAQMLLREGPKAVKKLLEKILTIRANNAIEAFKYKRYEGYSYLTQPLPLQLYKPDEQLLTVGIPDIGKQFREQRTVFSFKSPPPEQRKF